MVSLAGLKVRVVLGAGALAWLGRSQLEIVTSKEGLTQREGIVFIRVRCKILVMDNIYNQLTIRLGYKTTHSCSKRVTTHISTTTNNIMPGGHFRRRRVRVT